MKKVSNPKDLVVAQMSELLWVERRLAFDVLPELIDAISDDKLRELIKEHHEETQEHVTRVEAVFKQIGMEPSSAFSPAGSALFEHHDEIASKIVEPHLEDRWHASAAIATEHLELALYTPLDLEELAPNVKDEAGALSKLERWLRES